MKCPFCGHPDSKVIDSRESKKGISIRRRRECISCLKRFTTYEKIEEIPYMVVKKDGIRQPFDGQKLLRGLLRACEKRPVRSAGSRRSWRRSRTRSGAAGKGDRLFGDRAAGHGETQGPGQGRLRPFRLGLPGFKDVMEFKQEAETLLKE